MMKNKLRFLSLVLFLLVGACTLRGDPLDGTKWQLFTIKAEAPIEGSNVTLEFADQRLSGSSGCNAYGAEYLVTGDNIEVDMIAATLMACEDNGIMAQESHFVEALQQASSFELEESNLTLFDEAGNMLLEFTKVE